jgi:hypothetical protein
VTRRRGFLPIPDPSKTDRCDRDGCGCIEGAHLICGCQGCGHCSGFLPPLPSCEFCGEKMPQRQLDKHTADRPLQCIRAQSRRTRGYDLEPVTAGR